MCPGRDTALCLQVRIIVVHVFSMYGDDSVVFMNMIRKATQSISVIFCYPNSGRFPLKLVILCYCGLDLAFRYYREGEEDLRWRVRDVGSKVGGLVPELGGLS